VKLTAFGSGRSLAPTATRSATTAMPWTTLDGHLSTGATHRHVHGRGIGETEAVAHECRYDAWDNMEAGAAGRIRLHS